LRSVGVRPVFFDAKGRRRYVVAAVFWSAFILMAALLACLLASSIFGPVLSSIELARAPRVLHGAVPAPRSRHEPAVDPAHRRSPAAATAAAALRYGHFVNWDENSFSSLKRNAGALDVLVAEWLRLGDDGALVRDNPRKEETVRKWIAANAAGLEIYPLVNNYDMDAQRWDGGRAARMLASEAARSHLARSLYGYAREGRHGGLVVDLEAIPPAAMADYAGFVEELAALLHSAGLRLLVAAPASDPAYDYARVAAAADALILMTYDEHGEAGDAGPLAGQGWFEARLDERLRTISPAKLVVGIGSYGYDWAGRGDAREISVQEAWELLEASRAPLSFDKASLNPTFTYVDEDDGRQHQVWYLDGVTAHNQVAAALAMKPAGLALWRLGTEEPSVWATFGRGRMPDQAAREALTTLRSGYDLLYKGRGEVLSVSGESGTGARALSFDGTHNLVTDQWIHAFAKSTTVSRWGARGDKVIALTFDDGPDPMFTPQILDILAAKEVKATFFVLGSAGAVNRSLLRRIYEAGHDIGNHTFTHVNVGEASANHLRLELNATQRLLEATIGVQTKLFRPPYARDLEPQTIDAADVLKLAASMGYLTIGMSIDPKDWARPFPEQIVESTLEGARKGKGNVVLLHDAGGVRTATILALPPMIDRLRADGFRFVTIHELLDLPREAVMPRVRSEDALVVRINHAGFILYSGMSALIDFLFKLGLVLGTVRLAWVALFALVHWRRERRRAGDSWTPKSVCVVIPAFNEGAVIRKSIRALLASRLEGFRILVVDDGSTDRTAAIVRRAFAGDGRVEAVSKPNGGKWSALNTGLGHTEAEVVVTIDADTVLEPDALSLLVRHFADPRVAAVAGAPVVGNRVNLLTRLQALEYAINQNLDRRALEVVNGITVVPGAVGAWRREALLGIGGFDSDTLAEDADATVRLELAGFKVLSEPRAVAHTEAPQTVRAFLKQRLRWMFGTMQVAYKNRAVMWRGRPSGIAMFGLPNIIVFQFLFTLIAPLMDLMLVWTAVAAVNSYTLQIDGTASSTLWTVATYWLYFQLIELLGSALAIALEGRRWLWRLLPLVLVQRFCYRQLLYVTAVRVAAAALKGRMLGWDKLMRTGAVALQPRLS
jgi:cellulose synthase/poly-beta-1,6-N-acetylglucosamine synthase-like glycosyltransferase/peptidoglycan/xylan/chitin deacetylase (PgdA/CDA1 family)/spore germination protein YaaH